MGKRVARRSEAQVEVNAFAEKYRNARSKKWKTIWRLEWHFEQQIFDIINDSLPARYKAKLENRSYGEGASREGNALEEYRRSRRRELRAGVRA